MNKKFYDLIDKIDNRFFEEEIEIYNEIFIARIKGEIDSKEYASLLSLA